MCNYLVYLQRKPILQLHVRTHCMSTCIQLYWQNSIETNGDFFRQLDWSVNLSTFRLELYALRMTRASSRNIGKFISCPQRISVCFYADINIRMMSLHMHGTVYQYYVIFARSILKIANSHFYTLTGTFQKLTCSFSLSCQLVFILSKKCGTLRYVCVWIIVIP